MTQSTDAAQRSAHVARGGEDHGKLQAWAEDAIRTGRARLPWPQEAHDEVARLRAALSRIAESEPWSGRAPLAQMARKALEKEAAKDG